MLRHQIHGLGLGEGKGRQGGDDIAALSGIEHHGVLGAVIDLHLSHAVNAAQIVFQYVRLVQRHVPAVQMHPQTPG